MYINKDVTPAVARRQRIERTIVRRVVKDALAAGYELSVDDGGEEYAVEGTTSYRAVMDALMNTDDDKLILRRTVHHYRFCAYHAESLGWDACSEDFAGCEVAEARLDHPLAERYAPTVQSGWVRFVYGNDGWDVIADYTTSLDALIEPLMAEGGLIEKLEARASRAR